MALPELELGFDSIHFAVHAVVFNQARETLILQRVGGLWLLPGGRVDPRDVFPEEWTQDDEGTYWSPNLLDPAYLSRTLVRELIEEQGIKKEDFAHLDAPRLINIGTAEWFRPRVERQQLRTDIIFGLDLGEGRLNVELPSDSEIMDYRWTSLYQPTIPSGEMPQNVRGVLKYAGEVIRGERPASLTFFDTREHDMPVPVVESNPT